jgi:hypothetical protein
MLKNLTTCDGYGGTLGQYIMLQNSLRALLNRLLAEFDANVGFMKHALLHKKILGDILGAYVIDGRSFASRLGVPREADI